MRSLTPRTYVVAPIASIRPSDVKDVLELRLALGLRSALTDSGEVTVSLKEIVGAFVSQDDLYAIVVRTRRHDYYRWLPRIDPREAGFRRVPALGSYWCPGCRRWAGGSRCVVCEEPAEPRTLWVDPEARVVKAVVELREGRAYRHGVRLTPFEVLRLYRDSLGRTFADLLTFFDAGERPVGDLIPLGVRVL
ncbi:MAG: hypothetical protein QXP81_08565 [Nitrososphaerota archaeon]